MYSYCFHVCKFKIFQGIISIDITNRWNTFYAIIFQRINLNMFQITHGIQGDNLSKNWSRKPLKKSLHTSLPD